MGAYWTTLVLGRVLVTMGIYLHLEVKSATHGYIIRPTWCICIHVICKDLLDWATLVLGRVGYLPQWPFTYTWRLNLVHMVILLRQLDVFIYM